MSSPAAAVMPPPLPASCTELHALPHWQRVDFISDLHLDGHDAATFDAWRQYMGHTPADALFVLGDLFEVWVGDDTSDAFSRQCLAVLQHTAQRMPVYFICGNRDFLVGPAALAASGMQALSDPAVLTLGTQRLLLSHGDSLCLADHDYQAFRAQVRHPDWQTEFLAKPWAERHAMGQAMRQQSETRKRMHTDYADVDTAAATLWLQACGCQTMVHGHTHRPAEHDLGQGLTRWVLSDWDAKAQPPRLQVLAWLREKAQSPTRGLCRLDLNASS